MTEPPAGREPTQDEKPGRLRRVIVTGFKLALAIGLLTWLFLRGDLDPETLKKPTASPGTLVLALSLGFLSLGLSGVRWWILLGAERIRVPLLMALRLTYIGHFWNMVIPGAVSGDAVKMYYVGKLVPKDQREESWSTVFADRVIGLVALITLSAVAASCNLDLIWPRPPLRATYLLMLGILGAAALGGGVLVSGVGRGWEWVGWLRERMPLGELLARAYNTFRRLSRRPGRILAAYGLSLVGHCLGVTNALLLGLLFTDALGALEYFALVPIAMFSNAIPLTPGGVGIGEEMLKNLFVWAGAGGGASEAHLAKAGVSVMVWLRVVFYAVAVFGGLLYALYKRDDPGQATVGPDEAA